MALAREADDNLQMPLIRRLARRSEGQDLIEYALLASLISVTVIVALDSIGIKLSNAFVRIDAAVTAVGAPASGAIRAT